MDIQELLSQIGLKLSRLHDQKKNIDETLGYVGKYLNVSRVYIFEDDELRLTTSNTYEWCNKGIKPEKGNLQNVPYSVIPSYKRILEMEKIILADDIKNLPKDLYDILKPQNIKSILIFPLIRNDTMNGFIGFDICDRFHHWTKKETVLAKILSGIYSNFLERKKITERYESNVKNYHSFLETIQDMIIIGTAEEGKILYANRASIDALGYSLEELKTMKIIDVHPEENQAEAQHIIAEMLEGKRNTCPLSLKRKDGSKIPVETRAWIGNWEDQTCIFGVSRDITERHRAEKILEKSRKKAEILRIIACSASKFEDYQMLLDNLLDKITKLLDIDGGGIYIINQKNKNFAELVTKKNVDELFEREVRLVEVHRKPYDMIFVKKKPLFLENYERLHPRIAKEYNIKAVASIPIIAENDVIGAVNVFQYKKHYFDNFEKDILETIGIEVGNFVSRALYKNKLLVMNEKLEDRIIARTKELEKLTDKLKTEIRNRTLAEIKYQRLFESVGEGICQVDEKEQITVANDAANKIFATDNNGLIGKSLYEFVDEEGKEIIDQQVKQRKMGITSNYELMISDAVKQEKTIDVTVSPRFDEDRYIGTISIFRDITDKKIAENKAKELELQMFTHSKMASLGKIATGIAHEINQPLTYINTVIQTLIEDFELDEIHPENSLKRLENCEYQVQRIVKIISHLRTFGRVDDNILEKINVTETFENSLLILYQKIKLRNIVLEKDLEKKLPKVKANSIKLEQVFINLLQNAVDALEYNIDEPKIIVSIKNQKNEKIEINIIDNGPGIPEEIQRHLFDPFWTTKEVGKGTGLGLSIVYGIIDSFSGQTECISTPGEGTNFRISLPIENGQKEKTKK